MKYLVSLCICLIFILSHFCFVINRHNGDEYSITYKRIVLSLPRILSQEEGLTEEGGYLKEYKEPTTRPIPSLSSVSLRILISLSAVLIIILGIFCFRKYIFKGVGIQSKGGMIRVIDTLLLGPKRQLILLEILGEVILVGVSGERISLIRRIGKKEGEELKTIASQRSSAFSRHLESLLKKERIVKGKGDEKQWELGGNK